MKKGTYPKKKKINGKIYTRVFIFTNVDMENSYEYTETMRSQGKAAQVIREPGASHHAIYVRDRIGPLCSMCGKPIQRGKGERHRGLSFHKTCW